MSVTTGSERAAPTRPRYVKAVGPRLKKVLFVVLGLFALLAVNSTYLVGVSILERATGRVYQNRFYLDMFVVHLVLGALFVVYVRVFMPEKAVPGWAFITVGMFLLGGIQLLMMGVIGSYLGRVYVETQDRPLYSLSLIARGRDEERPH